MVKEFSFKNSIRWFLAEGSLHIGDGFTKYGMCGVSVEAPILSEQKKDSLLSCSVCMGIYSKLTDLDKEQYVSVELSVLEVGHIVHLLKPETGNTWCGRCIEQDKDLKYIFEVSNGKKGLYIDYDLVEYYWKKVCKKCYDNKDGDVFMPHLSKTRLYFHDEVFDTMKKTGIHSAHSYCLILPRER